MSPKEECENLLSFLMPFAEDQLKKHGEFYPFGAVLLENDEIEGTAAESDDDLPSEKVIEMLTSSHKTMASEKRIKASGIVWNASIQSKDSVTSDAVICSLEHKDDYSVLIAEPYKINLLKKVKFGDLSAMPGKHDIFGDNV